MPKNGYARGTLFTGNSLDKLNFTDVAMKQGTVKRMLRTRFRAASEVHIRASAQKMSPTAAGLDLKTIGA
jgi:hypothetical protein